VRLYLGQIAPADLNTAADNPNAAIKKEQVCEANFYSGRLALQRRKKDDAKHLFELAVAECPRSFLEYGAANAELRTLRPK
jgi:lipoprotein NlpI